ncbi:DUF1152 domain-containing protein [Pseudomonas sp. GD03651]|jgi:hypothetical protein|uniref:Uncharacterized protein n=1 Tax=Pseudomonas fortuita TaxID=3233375 RepID=A0ACD4P7Y5_9PSED|nr:MULTISPECIES: hypothetical protein [Pseudomonas]ERT17971.1 hypothetical protein O162_14455 [Pseudomonas putida SJ3]AGN83535.1 hypothetical protein L483_32370 [Pseudomonas putida H8234]MBH3469155.1 hypothetical protein [Pseudomonas putida]MDH2185589.1 DUF1152 domain-containing protein [Pseudomonas sp. GD03651]WAP63888.1 hypothetical protein OZ911_00285 [Pseudomonas putida]
MAAKMKSGTWQDFSQRFLRAHGMPVGCELRLYRKDGRKVRSDLGIKRRAINRSNITVLKGSDRISELITDAARLLSTDVLARGYEMGLYSPEGDRVYGQTYVETIRSLQETKKQVDPIEVFIDLLEDAGVDDLTLRQVGSLYSRLSEIFDNGHFEKMLLKAPAALGK